MNTNFIATWCFAPYFKKENTQWRDEIDMWACAKASLESVYDLYGVKVKLYTDSLGMEIFPMLTDKVELINAHDNVYDDVPEGLWAWAKIETYKLQTEPYIHIDLDFILKKKLPEDFFAGDLAGQVIELTDRPIPTYDNLGREVWYGVYNLPIIGTNYELPSMYMRPLINTFYPLNVGILVMNNMEVNKIYLDTVQEFLDNNRLLINYNYKTFGVDSIISMAVLEQQTLGILIKDMKLDCRTLLPNGDLSNQSEVFITFCGEGFKWNMGFLADLRAKYLDKYKGDDVQLVVNKLNQIRKDM
jgi:hypothetical protein